VKIADATMKSRFELETKRAARCGQAEASRKWIRSELGEKQRDMLLQSFSNTGTEIGRLNDAYAEAVKMMRHLLTTTGPPYEACDAVSFAQLFQSKARPSGSPKLVYILSSDEGSDDTKFFGQAKSLVQRSAAKWVIITENARHIPTSTERDTLLTVQDVQNVHHNGQFDQFITDQTLCQIIHRPGGVDKEALADETKERKTILAEADEQQRQETQRIRGDGELVRYYLARYKNCEGTGVHVVFIIRQKSVALMISRWVQTQNSFSVVENPDSMWD